MQSRIWTELPHHETDAMCLALVRLTSRDRPSFLGFSGRKDCTGRILNLTVSAPQDLLQQCSAFVISDTSTFASSIKGASKNETLCLGYCFDRTNVHDCSGGRNTNQWSACAAGANYNVEHGQHVEHSACYGDTHRAWSEIDQ